VTSRQSFAMLLDAALARANLTRAALAEKLGVTRQAVGNWLRDEHPSPELMGKLLFELEAYTLLEQRQALLNAYAAKTGALPADAVKWAAR
jgi:transcriptional regulator with XRE-family HTH domain